MKVQMEDRLYNVFVAIPSRAVDTIAAWYRLYLLIVLIAAGPGLLFTVSLSLGLWIGFGIRWGW